MGLGSLPSCPGRARLAHTMGEDSIQASLGGISQVVSVTESFLPEFHLRFSSWGAFVTPVRFLAGHLSFFFSVFWSSLCMRAVSCSYLSFYFS